MIFYPASTERRTAPHNDSFQTKLLPLMRKQNPLFFVMVTTLIKSAGKELTYGQQKIFYRRSLGSA